MSNEKSIFLNKTDSTDSNFFEDHTAKIRLATVVQVLYSHEQLYIHIYICICMQNHNDDTIKTSDAVL